jgi:hypothetical protein
VSLESMKIKSGIMINVRQSPATPQSSHEFAWLGSHDEMTSVDNGGMVDARWSCASLKSSVATIL